MSGELPEGMKPWDGGDAAPADYDGGKVLSRAQGLQYPDRLNGNRWGRQRTHPFFHEDEESCDIIAYTPMNPHQKPQEDVVVTQEDRKAIASLHALQHDGTVLAAQTNWGGSIIRWAVDEIKGLRTALQNGGGL